MTDITNIDTKAARTWLRDHGYDVGRRGRLSATLQTAYDERDRDNDPAGQVTT